MIDLDVEAVDADLRRLARKIGKLGSFDVPVLEQLAFANFDPNQVMAPNHVVAQLVGAAIEQLYHEDEKYIASALFGETWSHTNLTGRRIRLGIQLNHSAEYIRRHIEPKVRQTLAERILAVTPAINTAADLEQLAATSIPAVSTSSWQLDLGSLVIGLVIGALLLAAVILVAT